MIYSDEELDKKIDQLDILLALVDDSNIDNEFTRKVTELSDEIYDYETIHFPLGEPIQIENSEQYEIARRAIELKLESKHIENLLNALDTYEMTHFPANSDLRPSKEKYKI